MKKKKKVDKPRSIVSEMLCAYTDEVREAIVSATDWKISKTSEGFSARFFTANSGGWRFVVSDFDISDQGFPPGTRGFDGAATNKKKNVVLHLPRAMAEYAVSKALECLPSN